jgi:hypothetical protein
MEDQRFPDAGLVNDTGIAKPTAIALQNLRSQTLRR